MEVTVNQALSSFSAKILANFPLPLGPSGTASMVALIQSAKLHIYAQNGDFSHVKNG